MTTGTLSPHVYTPTRIVSERHPVKMTRSPTTGAISAQVSDRLTLSLSPDNDIGIWTLSSLSVTLCCTGGYVYWFAENSVGWAQLNDVALPAGTTLTLAHGEQLAIFDGKKLKQACLVGCENGSVWYAWGGAIDSYTLRGGEKVLLFNIMSSKISL